MNEHYKTCQFIKVRIDFEAASYYRKVRETVRCIEILSGEAWSAPRPLLIDGNEYRRRSRKRSQR